MDNNKSRSLDIATNNLFCNLLRDDNINEICYNGEGRLSYQLGSGIWEHEKVGFSYDSVEGFATACASFNDDVINEKKPILSASLNTGERVQIVIPPVTQKGIISVTIRKPNKTRFEIEDFKKQGLFSEIVHKDDESLNEIDTELKTLFDNNNFDDFLTKAVGYGKNVVIAGETGSGKTTLMKSLIDFIPLNERLITIEDVSEIEFHKHINFVKLFYPSEAKEGDLITSASLLKSCLRMKPDRILLAELRGAETYDFINVLSSGHNGSITSCHAGGVNETFTRLALMCLQNKQGQCVPFEILQKMLRDLIDVVVHIYAHNGKRRISDIYFKEANK